MSCNLWCIAESGRTGAAGVQAGGRGGAVLQHHLQVCLHDLQDSHDLHDLHDVHDHADPHDDAQRARGE